MYIFLMIEFYYVGSVIAVFLLWIYVVSMGLGFSF